MRSWRTSWSIRVPRPERCNSTQMRRTTQSARTPLFLLPVSFPTYGMERHPPWQIRFPVFSHVVGKRIVWVGGRQQSLDGKEHRADLQCGGPLILQDVEADAPKLVWPISSLCVRHRQCSVQDGVACKAHVPMLGWYSCQKRHSAGRGWKGCVREGDKSVTPISGSFSSGACTKEIEQRFFSKNAMDGACNVLESKNGL